MTTIIEIPLNSGMDQGVDRVLLGQDKLAYVQNARLTRDGRLEVRPSFTALSSGTMSSQAMVAYDLTNYSGRLVALGDQLSRDRATDLFEWLPSRGVWRSTSGGVASGLRLPQMTDVRSVGALPDQFLAVDSVKLAFGGGYICAVINYQDAGAPFLGSVVHIFDPATDQTLFMATVDLKLCTVAYAGTEFWVYGVDVFEDVRVASFDPATDQSLSSTTLVVAGTAILDLAVTNFGTGMVAAAVESATSVLVRHISSAGAVTGSLAIAGSFSSVAVAGNAGGTAYTVATLALVGGACDLRTYSAADALTAGPTTVVASTSVPRLTCTIRGGSVDVMACDGPDTIMVVATQSAHTFTAETYYDARVLSAPARVGNQTFGFFADREALDTNVGTAHIADRDTVLPQAFLDAQLTRDGSVARNAINQAAVDGTKAYFANLRVSQDLGTGAEKVGFTIYEAEAAGTGRRQMVQVGGELLIAGGLPLTYDGRALCEQGFAERPVIVSSAEGTTGSLTLLGVYRAVPVWEVFDARGRLLRSQAGSVAEITLTGANDDVTWTVTTPHSLRRHPFFRDQQLSVRVSIYRTEAGEGVFFVDRQIVIDPADDPAEFVTITSTQSDANLIDNAVLYEQSQAALPNVSPPPYRYVWPARERAIAGGLPQAEGWQFSKLLFPGEPLEWAFGGRLGFSGRVGQQITAVAAFETTGLVWTASEIWQIPGRGPEHNGTGEFDPSTPIATPGGTYDWRSVIVAPPGAFFQMTDDRLMLLDRAGQVSWAGSPVQDTLADYPDIAGCVFVRQQDIVAFACNDAGGTDGVILVFDLKNAQWFVDVIGAPIDSLTEFEGRLVYVSAGQVFLQDAVTGLGVGALPDLQVDTPSYRFFSAGGYGDVYKVCMIGTYMGDCALEAFISYDDGQTWTSMGVQAVTAAALVNSVTGTALTAGDPVTLIWQPATMQTDRFRIRVVQTHPSATAGCRWHVLSLEVEAVEGTTRQAATRQR